MNILMLVNQHLLKIKYNIFHSIIIKLNEYWLNFQNLENSFLSNKNLHTYHIVII